MKILKMAIVAITFGMAGAALAQQGGPPGGGNPAFAAVRAACQADMEKLCAGKQGPDMRQCLTDHVKELSKPCADARAAAMAAGGGAPRPQ